MDVPPDARGLLTQPTRARLFALLGELRRPAGTDELAESLALHPNGVRQHLDRLREAGLVVRQHEHGPRGRPRDTWAVGPGAGQDLGRPSAYADLSRWLARALDAGPDGAEAVEETGREIGREVAPRAGAAEPPSPLWGALATMGFRPRTVPGRAGEQCFVLGNCPYRDAVSGGGGAVCALHRGITRGLLDVLEPGSVLADFRPEDPHRAGCGIVVRGTGGERAPAG